MTTKPAKRLTVKDLVYNWAEANAEKLILGDYSKDYDNFVASDASYSTITFGTFKGYIKHITEPNYAQGKFYNPKFSDPILARCGQAAKQRSSKKDVALFDLSSYNPDPKLFKPWKTGKEGLDNFMSDDKGFMPGTSYFFAGGPGSGKTTIGTDAMVAIEKNHKGVKCGYLNSEMKPLDLAAERRKRPSLNKIKNIFLMAQHDNPKEALEKFLMMGWDFVVVDSFEDVKKRLRGWVSNDIPGYLLKLMSGHNDDAFGTGHHTCFYIIQHVNKGGSYKGGTDLEHDTTGFVHTERDEEGNRFIWASKNRRNGSAVERKLYYTLKDGEMHYDMERWKKDEEMGIRYTEEKERLKKDTEEFFGKTEVKVNNN